MAWNLSSSGVKAWCKTSKTFPVGFPVDGFADGDAISSAQTQIADMVMGVDGQAGVYIYPSPKEITITLMPSTPAAKNFALLASAMERGIVNDVTYDEITLSVALPAQGEAYVFSGGVMTAFPSLPNIKQKLENVQYTFKFEKMSRTSV